jgi:hypothetical protein
MNGAATREIRAVPPSSAPGRGIAVALLVVIVLAAGALLMLRAEEHLRGAPKVPEVHVVNSSDLLVDVDVSDGSGDGWLPIGIARPRDVTTVEDVVDQGDRWHFRFRSTGVEGGEIRVTEEQLEAAGWRVSIPEPVVEQLQRDGARPPVGSF